MMAALLVAGIGFLLSGLLAIGFGIPVQEFSFGNTLILAGTGTACTGAIMLALWVVVRELKVMTRQLGVGSRPKAVVPHDPANAIPAPEDHGLLSSRDQPPVETGAAAQGATPPPWLDQPASRERVRTEPSLVADPVVEAPPPPKQKRNLLFSSSSRKERERAQARSADPGAIDAPVVAPPVPEPAGTAPATFDDAWPKSERAHGIEAPPRRNASRAPSTFAEAGATVADRYPPAARNDEQPPVTVLKSGVVDGMAYSLYSDGSIEAQMPEGMMRFASIDELRSHLDQRP